MSYCCLTAHFLDDNWKLHKRILNFRRTPSHKGKEVGKIVEPCLLEWVIDRICTLTVDNTSSNSGTINYLREKLDEKKILPLRGEFFHMRCVAHILNLIVKDGLREMDSSVAKIRNAIKYVKSSPSREAEYSLCVEKEMITSKASVFLDVQHRWNSTYLMLVVAIGFQKAFKRLDDEDSQFTKELDSNTHTSCDWERVRVLVKFLKQLCDATTKLCGNLYATSNLYFEEFYSVEVPLKTWARLTNSDLSKIASKMKLKFEKYWGRIGLVNNVILIPVILDPRYKLWYLRFCYSRMYDSSVVDSLMSQLRLTLTRLFGYYKSESSSPVCVVRRNVVPRAHGESEDLPLSTHQADYMEFMEIQNNLGLKYETERYLEEPTEKVNDPKFNILLWWKVNAHKYRVLLKIAKDFLAIPVSTVASESAFSTGGHVLDRFRSSLTPKYVECLLCGQDWLRAEPIPLELDSMVDDIQNFKISDFEISDFEMTEVYEDVEQYSYNIRSSQ